MRFQVNIPKNMVPAVAGTQIHVYEAGTTNHVSQVLYGDPVSNTTLGNPYSHPGGMVNFYVAQPAKVSIGVQPAGAASPVITPPVSSSSKVFSYNAQMNKAAPPQWILT